VVRRHRTYEDHEEHTVTEPSSTPPDKERDNGSENTPENTPDHAPDNGSDHTRDDIPGQAPGTTPEEQETSIWGRADEPSVPTADGTTPADQSPYSDTPHGTASYDTAAYGDAPYGQQNGQPGEPGQPGQQYGQPGQPSQFSQPGQPGQPGPYNQQLPPQGQGYPQGYQGNPGYPGGPAPAGYPAGYPAGAPAYGMNPGYPGPQGYPGYGVPQTSPKSKIAAALLAFFLGGFGVHNFYLDLKNRAIGQLATTVLSIILMIVGFAVMFSGFGDSYDSYNGTSGYYNTWDEDNGALIGTGLVLIVISSIALCVVGVWAFVEFILILVGSGNYAHDREGRPLN
jgi:TM2 domain-containing membrane protein YozV